MATKELTRESASTQTIEVEEYKLVLYNDDINTFDWVIQSLVDVCKHTPEQAEQCAFLVHCKGKYAVLHGDMSKLEPACLGLLNRGLTAEVQ